MGWWIALGNLCSGFLGAFIGAAWGSTPVDPPRHPKQDAEPFPVDLDELDRRHRGHGKDEL